MRQKAWTELAMSLANLRADLVERAERSRNKSLHFARIQGVDLSARVVCKTLRSYSTRFDGKRFMRIVATQTK